MGAQWVWIVRLLRVFLLAPLRVSKGADIIRFGRPALTTAALTCTTIWIIGGFLLIWSIVEKDNPGCFQDVIHKTMSVYNAKVVVTLINVSAFLTNTFCLASLYRRDLVNIIARNVILYAKANGKFKVHPFSLSSSLKAFIMYLYLTPYAAVNSIAILCHRQV